MQGTTFAIDPIAGWVAILAIILIVYFKKQKDRAPTPFLFFSNLKNLQSPPNHRQFLSSRLPNWLYQSAIAAFLLAFIDPHFLIPQNILEENSISTPPTEGIAIYLILDRSGSMQDKIQAKDQHEKKVNIPKMALLKEVTKEFISKESGNLIGLVAFARIPQILAPLTLDQKTLQDKLSAMQVVNNKEEDGTSMGYAIFKTAHIIAATRHYAESLTKKEQSAYTITNTIMVVVTDGFQDPNALDKGNRLRTIELEEAADYAKTQNIKLYIVNIDPSLGTEEFAPHRRLLERITQLTGGRFFLVNEQLDLQQIYETIDQLEKGTIPSKGLPEMHYARFSFYPGLIALGLFSLFAAFVLDSTLFRKTP